MVSPAALDAAARAYALVGFADGSLTSKEDAGFRDFVAADPDLNGLDAEARDEAWSRALTSTLASGGQGESVLAGIAAAALNEHEKAIVLRAARAAVTAERGGARRHKENKWLGTLEAALAG